jgi:hypothetical protein
VQLLAVALVLLPRVWARSALAARSCTESWNFKEIKTTNQSFLARRKINVQRRRDNICRSLGLRADVAHENVNSTKLRIQIKLGEKTFSWVLSSPRRRCCSWRCCG